MRRALACCLLFVALSAGQASGATYPPGWEEQPLVTGLTQPTAFDWTPDGRLLIAEKAGVVRVFEDGTLQTLLDISGHVESAPSHGHRGLLGLAVDSAFADNHFVYLLYTYRPPSSPAGGFKSSRLTRIELAPDNTVGAETVLVGTESNGACPAPANDVDCIPSDGSFHSVGTVRSDPDGTIWLGTGDSNASQLRVQDERSYAGKIIHVDRDGLGLPGHAFCPADADLTHVCARLHAKGFRNPYRFSLRADGRPAVGDVGELDREELDLVAKGGNYGWPCYEGTIHTPTFSSLAACQDLYSKEGTPAAALPPAYEYPHGAGAAIVGGPTYGGELLIGDYINGFIRALTIGSSGLVTSTRELAFDWFGVTLERTPGGDLAYADYGDGSPGTGSLRLIRNGGHAYPAGVLGTPGLRGYWRMGEASGTVVRDASGSADGTYLKGVALGRPGALFGDSNTAAGFDGVDDEATLSAPMSTAGSIEGWFAYEAGLVLVRDTTSANGWIAGYNVGGNLAYRVRGTSFVTNRPMSSLVGGWHHVVMTVDGSAAALYVDGALVHSGTAASGPGAVMPWRVMRSGLGNGWSRGRVDELAIYDRALTPAEVADHFGARAEMIGQQLPPPPTDVVATPGDRSVRLDWSGGADGYRVYRSNTPGGPYVKRNDAPLTSPTFTDSGLTNGTTYYYVVRALDRFGSESTDSAEVAAKPVPRYPAAVLGTPGLLGYWRLGETSGTVARDERSSANGSYLKGVALGRPGALAGDANTAAGFDGVDDEVTISGPGLALGSSGSIEGWFAYEAGLVLVRDTTSANGWIAGYNVGGSLAYRVRGTSFVTNRPMSSLVGGWHHVVMTVDGSAVALYIDGTPVHSGTAAAGPAAVLPWHVMRSGLGNGWSRGRVDELAIYDRALSQTEITQHYNAGI